MTGYTTHEVAELLGVPDASVRSWVRAGILEPERGARSEYRFSFRDLVLLKAGQMVCPRSPATFRTCTEGMV